MATKSKSSLASLGIKKIEEAAGIVEYRMKNGLKILLRENHSAPVVSFMVVYRVGSRNEAVGYTGSTHFLEHMMFKGTNRFNPAAGSGVMETFSRIGALLNATTWLDRTNYFECIPSEYLELSIKFEADRMRNLNLRAEDRNSEMTVVRNEFERGENSPSSALAKEVSAIAFREHPYHHPTIGWRTDVERVPLERLKEFYDTYYWPNNATVIVVGDFDPDKTLKMIHREFGKIPASKHQIPEVYTVEPPQEGERRVELRRAGDLPQLLIAYHTPEANHKDTYALAVMHAILGDSAKRSSRLHKSLLETGLASSAYSSNGEFRDPFLFTLGATLAPGKTFAELEEAIYAEIALLAREPADEDELKRAKSANRKGTILGSADPQTFANMLCAAESVANWKWLVEYDDRFDAVTAADVQRVAAKYFDPSNRTVGHFVPATKNGKAKPLFGSTFEVEENGNGKVEAKKKSSKDSSKKNRLELIRPGSGTKSNFAGRVIREVLPNGLTLLVLPNPGTGSVACHGAIAAGDYFTSIENSLLATLTAMTLTRGSENYSKAKLAQVLEEMGIRFGFSADRFRVGFGTLVTKEDFSSFVPVLADLIRRPKFPEEEFALVLKEVRAGLTRAMNDTGRRASNALMRTIYPYSHPFYDPSYEERLEELDRTGPGLLREFHRQNYGPDGSVFAVVGDIDPDQAISLMKDAFSDWTGSPRRSIEISEVPAAAASGRLEVNLDDKANVDILIGHSTNLCRKNKDFFAAQLANAALGKDTISARLGKVLRVKHGLTYGIYSYFEDSSFGAAPWMISLSVNPSNVSTALKLVNEVVADYIKTGISSEELEDEAGRAVGSFLVSLRSSDGIAAALSRFEFIGLGVGAMDTVADDFMSVKKKDVQEALRKYIQPDKASIVLAGTMSRVE